MARSTSTIHPGERRAQVRILEGQLADVDRAKGAWSEYVEALRGIVRIIEADQFGDIPEDKGFFDSVAELDPMRLRAKNALYAVNPNIPSQTDFGLLLETNLRTQPFKMFEFISEPMEGDRSAVTMRYLDARAIECDAVIDRRRLDALADLVKARAYAEEDERSTVTLRALLSKWRKATEKNVFARMFWWLFSDPLKLLIGGLILAAVGGVWAWIRHH